MMAAPYRHRQFSRHAVGSFVVVTILMGIGFFYRGYELPMIPIFLIGVAFIAAVHFVVTFLTVEVSDREFVWYFAGGFWPNRIARADIASVTRVRLPWWYGIGVKYDRPAWVYLVAPGAGVEVKYANGQVVRIGTDDPAGLMAALSTRA
jgi:ABC-type Fe3+-siderophore transport system permease subunit